MPSVSKLQTKFQLLLHKFMIQDHQVVDDTCLEKLLTHLSKDESGVELLQLAECRGFCECALQAFEKGVVGEEVLAFSLRLHGLLIRNEQVFTAPELQQSTTNVTLSPRWMVTNNASLQFSFVQMVAALLSHKTGIEWLKKSVVWKTVKKLYEKNSSIYVARECQSFLSQFALKINDFNPEITEEILKSSLTDAKSTGLNLLITFLELALKENDRQACKVFEARLSHLCAEFFQKPAAAEDGDLVNISKIQLLLIFCAVESDDTSLDKLEESCLELISRLIGLKNISAVQATTFQCQVYWKIVKPRVQHLKRQFKFEMQIVYIQLMPVMKNKNDEIETKEAIKHFLEILCSRTSATTQNTGCSFRKLCFKNQDHQKIACRSIHSLLQLKDVFERESAVFVFRALMCIVVQVVSSDAVELAEIQTNGLMRTTLEALIKMMDHFHFTWAESVETIDIVTYMQELLEEPALEQRQISPILQIMRRALEDFLPPNLALLTNTLEGSPLKNIGAQLFKCMHSTSWEVRDSALEVVAVVATISADKFPAFQEHLLQHNLCSLTAAMASGDEESYVRLSALSCLSAMVAVPFYWEKCLRSQKLPKLLTTILCQDSEGIVRQEAAKLATCMLLYERLRPEEKEEMYLVMAAAAATDFHWEVKVNALNFWESSVQQHLTCQGMIDGRFPDVTFSGSSRRIITLDKKELQSRLRKVLDELAKSRCLAVLITALNDPDLQVTRRAAAILKKLLRLLEDNDVLLKNLNQTADSPTEEMVCEPSEGEVLPVEDGTMANSNSILDDIMELSDLALLASVCRTQLTISLPEDSVPTPKVVELVQADEFLRRAASLDLDKLVGSREDWLFNTSEHLESLLTDMLEAREFKHNVNKMDCY